MSLINRLQRLSAFGNHGKCQKTSQKSKARPSTIPIRHKLYTRPNLYSPPSLIVLSGKSKINMEVVYYPYPNPFHSPAPILNQARDLKIDFRLTVQVAHRLQIHKIVLAGHIFSRFAPELIVFWEK